eukprot:GHRQ01004058.1.p2 GENE.GHRQ01004058.1~~GHRQ01004058.1.p2  ORF type:complete len:273 (-),score=12.47 GHRQ01004058.1:320-1138(-)
MGCHLAREAEMTVQRMALLSLHEVDDKPSTSFLLLDETPSSPGATQLDAARATDSTMVNLSTSAQAEVITPTNMHSESLRHASKLSLHVNRGASLIPTASEASPPGGSLPDPKVPGPAWLMENISHQPGSTEPRAAAKTRRHAHYTRNPLLATSKSWRCPHLHNARHTQTNNRWRPDTLQHRSCRSAPLPAIPCPMGKQPPEQLQPQHHLEPPVKYKTPTTVKKRTLATASTHTTCPRNTNRGGRSALLPVIDAQRESSHLSSCNHNTKSRL